MTNIKIINLNGDDIWPWFDAIADLRIQIFRGFPYLYDGTRAYEQKYLKHYLNKHSLIVGAFDGKKLVGAATCGILSEHDKSFSETLSDAGFNPETMLYCGESVLLPEYRGQGIGHAFFDRREAHGRDLGLQFSCFAAVNRPLNHPLKPENYQPLDEFWYKRDYVPLEGVEADFSWKDVDQLKETDKTMQIWLKML